MSLYMVLPIGPLRRRAATYKTAARPYRKQATMTQNLKFSHKILLAASLVVIAAFSLFTLYND